MVGGSRDCGRPDFLRSAQWRLRGGGSRARQNALAIPYQRLHESFAHDIHGGGQTVCCGGGRSEYSLFRPLVKSPGFTVAAVAASDHRHSDQHSRCQLWSRSECGHDRSRWRFTARLKQAAKKCQFGEESSRQRLKAIPLDTSYVRPKRPYPSEKPVKPCPWSRVFPTSHRPSTNGRISGPRVGSLATSLTRRPASGFGCDV